MPRADVRDEKDKEEDDAKAIEPRSHPIDKYVEFEPSSHICENLTKIPQILSGISGGEWCYLQNLKFLRKSEIFPKN